MSSNLVSFDDEDFDLPGDEQDIPVPTRQEIPEYYRIKIPTNDEYMSIACVYDGRENEHLLLGETEYRWLTDRDGEPYRFDTRDEARVFLALNVDPQYIRIEDRAKSIEAYAIRRGVPDRQCSGLG